MEFQIGGYEVVSNINVRRHLVQVPIELGHLIGGGSFGCKFGGSRLEKLTNLAKIADKRFVIGSAQRMPLENVRVEQVPLLPGPDIGAALRAHLDHSLRREHLD